MDTPLVHSDARLDWLADSTLGQLLTVHASKQSLSTLQGYLAHKKTHPPRTLPQDYA